MKLAPAVPWALIAGAICTLAPALGSAHAIVVKSTPAASAIVAPGPLDVVLDFNARLDPARSRLLLEAPDGTTTPIAPGTGRAPTSISGRSEVRAPGRWKVRWQVLAADGHITRGEIPFQVRVQER